MGTSQLLSVPYALFAASGNPGPQGPAGTNGTNGTDGQQGIQGLQGVAGSDGRTILNGTTDPVNEGVDGDFYINTSTATLFGPKSSGTWGSGTSLVGPAGTYTSGTGISIAGSTITNSAPDQAIILNNGTGISISGTYPNFTITNTAPDQNITLTGTGATYITGTYPNFSISSTDNNTTYSAGTGLTLTGTVFNSKWTIAGNNIYNNNTGFIGIGTTNPTTALHINGSLRIVDETEGLGKIFTSDANGVGSWQSPAIGNSTGTANYIPKFLNGNSLENSLLFQNGNYIGLGTSTPVGRFVIKGDSLAPDSVPLFEVKDKTGSTVFVVWPEGVNVFVRNSSGLAKSNNRGSFAVSGRSQTKTNGIIDYFNILPDSSAQIINPSEARVLWYPKKEAFLSGRVLIEHADSVGTNSLATGFESKAIGGWSQAMGYQAIARSNYSTAIGKNASALAANSFAFGDHSLALNQDAYSFGAYAQASGIGSFAFGYVGRDSIGPTGTITRAAGNYSFAFGLGSQALSEGAIAFGANDSALGKYSTAMGYKTKTGSWYSLAMGAYSKATGFSSIAMGYNTRATMPFSIAIGDGCISNMQNAIAMGYETVSSGYYSFTTGWQSIATGECGFSTGYQTNASGDYSAAMGFRTTASGLESTALGSGTISSGEWSTALGLNSNASGQTSTALGGATKAMGKYSTSMGVLSTAKGDAATTMGYATYARADNATATGYYTKANSYNLFVAGRFNDTTSTSATTWVDTDPLFSVGNGSDFLNLSNAMTILKNGNVGIGTVTPSAKLNVVHSGDINKNTILAHASQSSAGFDYMNSAVTGIGKGNGVGWGHGIGVLGMADMSGSTWYSAGVLAVLGTAIPNSLLGTAALYADGNNLGNAGVFMNGNVGIGTTTPSVKLDVVGSIKINNGTTIAKLQAGKAVVGSHTGGVKTITVTFPSAFATVPKITVTANGENYADVFVTTTRNITTTTFQVNIYRVDPPGSLWAQNLQIDWIAWE
jgi:hypothetical protein